MSKKAYLLTRDDVPQYIRDIVKRLQPVLMEYEDEDGNWWGYIYRLDAKWKCGYESQLVSDCEKLVNWCSRWYAQAKVISYHWWHDEVEKPKECDMAGTYSHMRKAWRNGFINHAFLVISDPAALRFEKDRYYK